MSRRDAMRAILCDSCSDVACSVPEHWSAERAEEECMQYVCQACGEIGRVRAVDDGDSAGLVFRAVVADSTAH